MQLDTELIKSRIDLHRVDVGGPIGQGDGDIVAVPRADDQDIFRLSRQDRIGLRIDRLGQEFHGVHRLVGNPVHGDVGAAVELVNRNLVVGRPKEPGAETLDAQNDDASRPRPSGPPPPGTDQHH